MAFARALPIIKSAAALHAVELLELLGRQLLEGLKRELLARGGVLGLDALGARLLLLLVATALRILDGLRHLVELRLLDLDAVARLALGHALGVGRRHELVLDHERAEALAEALGGVTRNANAADRARGVDVQRALWSKCK